MSSMGDRNTLTIDAANEAHDTTNVEKVICGTPSKKRQMSGNI